MRRSTTQIGEIRVVIEGADATAGQQVAAAVERAIRSVELGAASTQSSHTIIVRADASDGDIGERITRSIEERLR